MKILIVGASGTLGSAVSDLLRERHEILRAGRTHGDYRVDLVDDQSVRALFAATGQVDAIVAATGNVHFGPLPKMSTDDFEIGLSDKLMGQIRLALVGQYHLRERGSITLTTGILAQQPIRDGVNATTINAALEGFVRAAACELEHGHRINAVSPNALKESWGAYRDYFNGFEPVAAARAALAFQRSVEGVQTGQIYRVW